MPVELVKWITVTEIKKNPKTKKPPQQQKTHKNKIQKKTKPHKTQKTNKIQTPKPHNQNNLTTKQKKKNPLWNYVKRILFSA